ncbi:hypothetical protein IPH25_03840 [bacterium]|nr:MAG: hypothetical protein IPG37_00835 [bacterium]QQR61583.1 MAG: hypothetical protein IPH25_03840 [bacterium]
MDREIQLLSTVPLSKEVMLNGLENMAEKYKEHGKSYFEEQIPDTDISCQIMSLTNLTNRLVTVSPENIQWYLRIVTELEQSDLNKLFEPLAKKQLLKVQNEIEQDCKISFDTSYQNADLSLDDHCRNFSKELLKIFTYAWHIDNARKAITNKKNCFFRTRNCSVSASLKIDKEIYHSLLIYAFDKNCFTTVQTVVKQFLSTQYQTLLKAMLKNAQIQVYAYICALIEQQITIPDHQKFFAHLEMLKNRSDPSLIQIFLLTFDITEQHNAYKLDSNTSTVEQFKYIFMLSNIINPTSLNPTRNQKTFRTIRIKNNVHNSKPISFPRPKEDGQLDTFSGDLYLNNICFNRCKTEDKILFAYCLYILFDKSSHSSAQEAYLEQQIDKTFESYIQNIHNEKNAILQTLTDLEKKCETTTASDTQSTEALPQYTLNRIDFRNNNSCDIGSFDYFIRHDLTDEIKKARKENNTISLEQIKTVIQANKKYISNSQIEIIKQLPQNEIDDFIDRQEKQINRYSQASIDFSTQKLDETQGFLKFKMIKNSIRSSIKPLILLTIFFCFLLKNSRSFLYLLTHF